jgi:glycosyltransferase involved in cell wall biosynthesis
VEASLYQQIADSTSGKDLKARLIHDTLPARTRLIEQRALQAVDQIWVCSRDDARLMEDIHKPTAPIHVIPNTVDVGNFDEVRSQKFTASALSSTERTIIFPGIFAHPPNAIAAEFLVERIFPKLTTLYPDCKLLLVGSMPTLKMRKMAETEPRIIVTGRVPDIRPYLAAASVMVVPLFQGGGTRFKILEAFASNLPVISTAKGTEGIEVKDETHLLIAESAEEFVSCLRRLWRDDGLAGYLAANALNLVRERYSWDVTSRRIANAVSELDVK